MGMCMSYESKARRSPPPSPAKVILSDGGLREFARPVKAARVLEKPGAGWIVCDADGMDFDGIVSAVADNDELRPGQLYFVLPAAMLQQRLQAEEIAALAVKASAALARVVPTRKGWSRRVAPQHLVFAEPVRRQKGSGGKGKGRNLMRNLSAIWE